MINSEGDVLFMVSAERLREAVEDLESDIGRLLTEREIREFAQQVDAALSEELEDQIIDGICDTLNTFGNVIRQRERGRRNSEIP